MPPGIVAATYELFLTDHQSGSRVGLGCNDAAQYHQRIPEMNIFQTVSRTITTTVVDYNADTDEWLVQVSGKINGHEHSVEGEILDVSEKALAVLEAYFCWYLLYADLHAEDKNVDKSSWQDFAQWASLHGARIRTKSGRRR